MQGDEDVNTAVLSVYPTVVVSRGELHIYFERRRICSARNMVEAAATLVMVFYVYDVIYPKALANTYNFIDVCVGKIDKRLKVRLCVQRKMNILLA